MAWHPLGWTPAFFSEIEKFPSAVLAHHYPAVPNLGDMTRFEEWPDEPIDLLVGGTPCQSFSVAGLRKGLADPRGNLMLTYLAIAARYRPTWLVWENVPGALSVDGGEAFSSLIGGMAELGYHAAWRVLDAQYVRVDGYERAVPQRRKRVFVVGYLRDWRRAAAVFLEPESLSGNPPPRREAGQGVAPTISARPTGGGGLGTDFDCDGGLIAAGGGRRQEDDDNLVAHSLRAEGFDASEDGTGRGIPLTLAIRGRGDSHQLEYRQDGTANAILTPNGGRAGIGVGAIAFQSVDFGADASVEVSPTIRRHDPMAVATGWAVRRLTPRECERLQGFPDDFTAIPYRGKLAADGPRYKALGNSMAVNVMRWIGQRIAHVESLTAELGLEDAA